MYFYILFAYNLVEYCDVSTVPRFLGVSHFMLFDTAAMATLVVQSRFAGLKIEDDDYPPSDGQKSKKVKPSQAKKVEPPKKTKNNNKTQVCMCRGIIFLSASVLPVNKFNTTLAV